MKLKPWIYKILTNISFEILKRNKNYIDIEENIIESEQEDIDTNLMLWNAVQKLKQPYRTTITLFYYEDMSIKEISQITETSTDAIKKQLSRGREKLPNISPKISYAMQELPIIGNIVKVITIRKYFDKEGSSQLDANIPSIKNNDNSISESNKTINDEIKELTQRIINNYYTEKNPDNHISIEINPEIITNTNEWFTLKLAISQTSASSSIEYKYYHIDKKTDKIVKLSDLFDNDGYKSAISEEIKKQMIYRMKENKNIVYWFDEESKDWSFRKIDDNQNFYFSEMEIL